MVEQKKLKLGVVVIQLNDIQKVEVVAGTRHVNIVPDIPFSDISINFLDELSNVLRKSAESKIYADLMAFSFWCRKGNINKLKHDQDGKNQRIGRGLAFHIAPSNVPLNFGYSFIFGLLSGNSNIISCILFNTSLSIVGLTFMMLFYKIKNVFVNVTKILDFVNKSNVNI